MYQAVLYLYDSESTCADLVHCDAAFVHTLFKFYFDFPIIKDLEDLAVKRVTDRGARYLHSIFCHVYYIHERDVF